MDIKSLTYEELQNEIMVLDEPKFRAGQIFDCAGCEVFSRVSCDLCIYGIRNTAILRICLMHF